MKFKIEYLDSKKNFRYTVKQFRTWESAEKWGRKHLDNFNLDMINHLS